MDDGRANPDSRSARMIPDCQVHLVDALVTEMHKRHDRPHDEWIAAERTAVATAANTWADKRGIARRVATAEVERLETSAMGYVDYAQKLCLYVAEFLLGFREAPGETDG